MANGQYPYFRPLSANEATRARINGREVIMVGSNNYLGLTHDPRVVEASRQALVAVRHELHGLAVPERHPRAARGARGPAREVPQEGSRSRLLDRLPGEPRRDLGARRQGRRHLLRPREPRVDHRRLPAFVRRGEEVPPRRHGRPAPHARTDAGRQGQADHRRRRVLDEREHHEPARRSSSSPRSSTRASWSTTLTASARSGRPAAGPSSTSSCSTTRSATSTSSRARSASRSRRSAASSPAPRTSSTTSSTTRAR